MSSAAELPSISSGCLRRLPAPSKDASRSLDQYKVYTQLYQGHTSMVLEARDRRTGAHVVLKVYDKLLVEDADRDQLEREMRIHRRLRHDNIIDLITLFEDEKAVYLVQSFAQGGDLFTALHAVGHFDESRTAGTVIAPLLSALDYIHSKGIIHRDIKIENILLDQHGDVKLADFGLAIDCQAARPRSRLGTWEYMAPEVHLCPFKGSEEYAVNDKATYSSSVDIWALGVLAFELLTGKPPFKLEGDGISYEDLMSRDLVFPDTLSPEACSFIRSALCKDARHRPSARQLLRHRWLRPYLKAELLEDDEAGPPTAARSRATRSLPLEVLHMVEPAPAETDTGAALEHVRRVPVNPGAGADSGAHARPPPKSGSVLDAGGPSAMPTKTSASNSGANPAAGQRASPTTPLSCTGSSRASEESGASSSAGCASPSPKQPPVRAGSGALAAATAGLLRRLPHKIQSLMNLGSRASNVEKAAQSISAARLPDLPVGSQGARSSAGAAVWADALGADEARGLSTRPVGGGTTGSSSPKGGASAELKGDSWTFARLVGRLGQRNSAAIPDLPGQLPSPSSPLRASPLVPPEPGQGQGPSRRATSDRDLAARLALPGKQAPAAPKSALEPALSSPEPTGAGRTRQARTRTRAATCSDQQLQLLLDSGDRLWSGNLCTAASPQRSSGVSSSGSADDNVFLSSSGVQLQGPGAGTAAATPTARASGMPPSRLSPRASGGEWSLPMPSPWADAAAASGSGSQLPPVPLVHLTSEPSQQARGAGRSRARQLFFAPPGNAYF